MKRQKFDDSQDPGNAAAATAKAREGACSAPGCPNLWSTSVGHVCRWHADAPRERWDEVTRELLWDEAERARNRGNSSPRVEPLSRAEKLAILHDMRAAARRMTETSQFPRLWALVLFKRDQDGDRLTPTQRAMYRQVLGSEA